MRDRWLSVRSVAEQFDLAPGTVSNWVWSGKVPAERIGTGTRKYVRIRLADIQALMTPIIPGHPDNIKNCSNAQCLNRKKKETHHAT